LREFLRYRHFVPVMGLLVIAQFIDRGLSLTIPLHVAHLPGIDASAAMSGIIISVAAAGAALSSSVVARLSMALPIGRLLFVQFLIGRGVCSACPALQADQELHEQSRPIAGPSTAGRRRSTRAPHRPRRRR